MEKIRMRGVILILVAVFVFWYFALLTEAGQITTYSGPMGNAAEALTVPSPKDMTGWDTTATREVAVNFLMSGHHEGKMMVYRYAIIGQYRAHTSCAEFREDGLKYYFNTGQTVYETSREAQGVSEIDAPPDCCERMK